MRTYDSMQLLSLTLISQALNKGRKPFKNYFKMGTLCSGLGLLFITLEMLNIDYEEHMISCYL